MSIFEQFSSVQIPLADVQALIIANLCADGAVDHLGDSSSAYTLDDECSFIVTLDRLDEIGVTRFALEISRTEDGLTTFFRGRVEGTEEFIFQRTFESEISADDVQVVVDDYLEVLI